MKFSNFFSAAYYRRKMMRLAKKINRRTDGKCCTWLVARLYYRERTGKRLSYSNPRELNEKLMWLTRYWQHPLKSKCADKYGVREYVTEKGLEKLLIPLIGVYDRAEDIPFEKLPNQFALKCTHGCGMNVICFDKSKLDIPQTISQLNQWLQEEIWSFCSEVHYRDVPHRIVCEELVGEDPIEYQLWCVNGEPDSMLVCQKCQDGEYHSAAYDFDWNRLEERLVKDDAFQPSRPACLDDLVRYAKILAAPFPFLRMDFYVVNNRIYVAEMTFTPAGNILTAYDENFHKRLGDKLQLPAPYKK